MTRKAISAACHGPLHCHGDPSMQPRRLAGLESLATITSYHRSQEICNQAGRADYWYCVISGTARRYMIRSDGRRQIVDLLFPGDFFGFTVGDEYDFTVEAVVQGTTVARYPRRPVEARADTDPQLARDIRQIAFEALSRLQAQLLTVGRITAREKVGSFLLDMAERLSNKSADQVLLPVSRYDIADYLAMSVETVSRSLTDLKHHGVIKLLGSRSVRILDRDSLEEGMRDARAGQLDVGRSANRMCSQAHSANSVRDLH